MKGKGWLLFGRWALRLALLAWLGLGTWNAVRTVGELRALRERGRVQQAQVIGREIVGPKAAVGYVHYAYKAEGFAAEDRFAVPRGEYGEYPTGRAFPVTYLPEQPHTHRRGLVDDHKVLQSELSALLSAVAGLLAFGLPLVAIELALLPRRPTATPVPV